MLEQGIHFNVPSEMYFGDPCPAPSLTQSLAKVLLERSPLHAKLEHPRLTPPKPDDAVEKYDAAKAIGNAAHSLLIGRGKDIAIGNFDAWTTKEAKLFKAEAFAAGKTPILDHHFGRAHAMVEAARAQIDAVGWNDAFKVGHGEVVIAWKEGDIWFRSLIDWMTSTTRLYDYKSTGLSCAPHAIPKLMADAGWDTQAAMHERGLDVLDPPSAGKRQFRFIAQENEPPYALTCVELPDACMTMGRKKIDMAVRLWAPCLRGNIWPSYPPEVCWPEYPGWKEAQFLDREIKDAARARTNGHREGWSLDSLAGG